MVVHLDAVHPAGDGAGSRSTLGNCGLRLTRDQNVIHSHRKQVAECQQMIGGGDGLTLLPEIDGLGRVETEELLNIGDRKVVQCSQALNISSGGNRIDAGKRNVLFILYLLLVSGRICYPAHRNSFILVLATRLDLRGGSSLCIATSTDEESPKKELASWHEKSRCRTGYD